MPVSSSVSMKQSISTPAHATPHIKALEWSAALDGANDKLHPTSLPTGIDQSVPTSPKQDQQKSPLHNSTTQTAKSSTDSDASPTPEPTLSTGKAVPQHLVKTKDKNTSHQNQLQTNPQVLPVTMPVTVNEPKNTTKPETNDDPQASATDTKHHSPQPIQTTNTTGYLQSSDAIPQTNEDLEIPEQTQISQQNKGLNSKPAVPDDTDRTTASKTEQTSTPSAAQALIQHNLKAAVITSASTLQNQSQINPDLKKSIADGQAVQPLTMTSALSDGGTLIAVDKPVVANASAVSEPISISASALSATITALHQSGQSGIVLRVDPPNLGHLSIHVKMDAQGAVNVLFMPSTSDAAQVLQGSLPQLGATLAQSGLTLGQAGIGGQFSQSGGHNGQQSGYTPARKPAIIDISDGVCASQPSGLSTYA